ncbi:hypothetical protein F5Y17DRAFT_369796 [Xylariaceae sp. FL0594]|nr:hypothetical protein F5Y17DRAFT_369796 [Xylariaceae sp. FL0594]
MAEAIAALGLACSIMQVITFTSETVKLTRNVFKHDSLDPSLTAKIRRLRELYIALEGRVAEFDPVYPDTDESGVTANKTAEQQEARRRLKEYAQELARGTGELEHIVAKLTASMAKSWAARIKALVQYKLSYSSRIVELQRSIDQTGKLIDSEFLDRICSSVQASHLCSMREFSLLKSDLKLFISQWSHGKRDMADLIISEAQATRALITTEAELTRHQINLKESELSMHSLRERLLATLRFDEMNQRENSIEEASDDTVDWVFTEQAEKEGLCSFGNWLSSDQVLFWIAGKAGSGKSTLMKHLINSRQTTSLLSNWRPSVLILRFFFFELGNNPLQTQLRGCLRTILHQLLSKGRNAANILSKLSSTFDALTDKFSEHDWSLRELQDALDCCLRVEDVAFCIFLDGLDEQNTDECNSVLSLIDSLCKLPNVKLCVASRAENVFSRRFRACPKIYMQYLTSGAMTSFVKHSIERYAIGSTSFMPNTSKGDLEEFATHLSAKSDGVFLWTALVLKGIIRGIQNGDTWETLHLRVNQYNTGLNGLFQNMWNRRDSDVEVYKKEAARLLRGTCKGSYSRVRASLVKPFGFGLCDTLLLGDDACLKQLREIIVTKSFLAKEDRKHIRAMHEEWLFSRSAGLVEMNPNSYGVDFVHRSAQDFLKNTLQGKEILGSDVPAPPRRIPDEEQVRFFHEEISWILLRLIFEKLDDKRFCHLLEYHMRIAKAMHRSSIAMERFLEEYHRWIPKNEDDTHYKYTLACLLAWCGILEPLKGAEKEIFSPLTQKEKAHVLRGCCLFLSHHLRYTSYRSQSLLRRSIDGRMRNADWGRLTQKQLLCVQWLLEGGADPTLKESDGFRISPFLDHKPYFTLFEFSALNAYDLFLQSMVHILLPYEHGRFPASVLVGWTNIVDACLLQIHKHIGEAGNYVFRITYDHQRKSSTPKIGIVASVSSTWFLKLYDRLKTQYLSSTSSVGEILLGFSEPELFRVDGVLLGPTMKGQRLYGIPSELEPEFMKELRAQVEIWIKTGCARTHIYEMLYPDRNRKVFHIDKAMAVLRMMVLGKHSSRTTADVAREKLEEAKASAMEQMKSNHLLFSFWVSNEELSSSSSSASSSSSSLSLEAVK